MLGTHYFSLTAKLLLGVFLSCSIHSAALSQSKVDKKDGSQAQNLEKQNRKFQALESFSRALNLLEVMYVDEQAVSSEVLIDKAIKGMISGLDPHTAYLPMQQLRDFATDTAGKFGGIGVIISQGNNRLEIVDVVADSPAFLAGVKPGEFISAIDGVTITPKNTEDVLSRMRGTPGSTVVLELYSEIKEKSTQKTSADEAKRSKIRKVSIKRDIIRNSSVNHAKLSNGYAYIRVSVFQEDTGEQVEKALRFYESQNGGKLDGLILDLRNNPGGLLDQAVKVANFFIDSGIIVSTIGRDRTKQEVEYATKRITHPYMPLVVLVNEGSASASEIVAGALQDHDRALIVGTTTFGKGSVQSIITLPNEGGLKMTIARYYTPKGRSIQAKGITPDIPLPVPPAPAVSKTGKPENDSEDQRNNVRKESDLEGHIEASDLSETARFTGFGADIEKWTPLLQKDYQLRAAYTYVKSWAKFSKNVPQPTGTPNKGIAPRKESKNGTTVAPEKAKDEASNLNTPGVIY